MTYNPKFQITPRMVKYLGAIDAAKAIAEELPIPLTLEQEFRKEAFIKMAHYSTKDRR